MLGDLVAAGVRLALRQPAAHQPKSGESGGSELVLPLPDSPAAEHAPADQEVEAEQATSQAVGGAGQNLVATKCSRAALAPSEADDSAGAPVPSLASSSPSSSLASSSGPALSPTPAPPPSPPLSARSPAVQSGRSPTLGRMPPVGRDTAGSASAKLATESRNPSKPPEPSLSPAPPRPPTSPAMATPCTPEEAPTPEEAGRKENEPSLWKQELRYWKGVAGFSAAVGIDEDGKPQFGPHKKPLLKSIGERRASFGAYVGGLSNRPCQALNEAFPGGATSLCFLTCLDPRPRPSARPRPERSPEPSEPEF